MHDFKELPHKLNSNVETSQISTAVLQWDMNEKQAIPDPQIPEQIIEYRDPSQNRLEWPCGALEPMLSQGIPCGAQEAWNELRGDIIAEQAARLGLYKVKNSDIFMPNFSLPTHSQFWLEFYDVAVLTVYEEDDFIFTFSPETFCEHEKIEAEISHFLVIGGHLRPRWLRVERCNRPECEEDIPF